MFVLLFAYVFGGAIDVRAANYREYLIGGILIQSLAFGMMGPATSIATDLTEGVDRPLPVAAVARRSAYLLGHYFAELLGSMLTDRRSCSAPGCIVGWRTAHRRSCTSVEAHRCCCSCSPRR